MEGCSLKSKVARMMRLRQEGEYSARGLQRFPAGCGIFVVVVVLAVVAQLLCGEVAFDLEE